MPISRTFTNGDDAYVAGYDDTYELSFLGGNDRLFTRGGTTTASMGAGNDWVRVEGGLARISGDAGADVFNVFAGGSRIGGGADDDLFNIHSGNGHHFNGGLGNDRFNFFADAASVRIDGYDGHDVFVGYSHAISGYIFGGGGNDLFLSFGNHGGRTVTLFGGTGNDLYRLDASSPATIVEYAGQGIDTVQIGDGASYTLGANIENVTVHGPSGAGSELRGNGLANRITGGVGADSLFGEAGNDRLTGSGGNDTIAGGAGNDRIYGGLGADMMGGDAGADTFVYGSAAEAPVDPSWIEVDWIYQFDALDRIDVSAIDANSDRAGVQHFTLVNGDGHEQGTLYFHGDPAGWGWIIISGYIDGDDQADFFLLITDDDGVGYPPVTPDSFILG